MPATIARVTVVRHESKLAARKRAGPRTRAAHRLEHQPGIRATACCMSSTRKLARLAAPVVCASYVAYVAVDRGYYHIERRKELDAATARRQRLEAARRVAADERR